MALVFGWVNCDSIFCNNKPQELSSYYPPQKAFEGIHPHVVLSKSLEDPS